MIDPLTPLAFIIWTHPLIFAELISFLFRNFFLKVMLWDYNESMKNKRECWGEDDENGQDQRNQVFCVMIGIKISIFFIASISISEAVN